MRTVAENMSEKSARTNLLSAAATWEMMAERAEMAVRAHAPEPVGRPRRRLTVVTCRCGARYQRKMVEGGPRLRERFDCLICKKPIEVWKSPLALPFRLVSAPASAKKAQD